MKVALVVPSIRPESLRAFLVNWYPLFEKHLDKLFLIIFETHGTDETRQEWMRLIPDRMWFSHITQKNVEAEWGEDAWILPQTNSSCRCFAIWWAAKNGADYIINEDDDAYPVDDVIKGHLDVLEQKATLDWHSIAPSAKVPDAFFPTRGIPWTHRRSSPVRMNQGLWTGVPDIDAVLQLISPEIQCRQISVSQVVPRWNFFPMSWMNVAMHRELIPAICPPPSIDDKPTDRFDDTWTGVVAKRIMDHLGWAAGYGPPFVHHVRATDPLVNIQVEARGMQLQEIFWRYVAECPLSGTDVFELSTQMANHLLAHPDSEYIRKCGEARLVWIKWWREAFGNA